MDIRLFEIKVSREEAAERARRKGSLVWKAVFAKARLSEIRQHFIEFKLLTFEVLHRPSLLERWFFHRTETKKQTVTVLGDGSTGAVAWVESLPRIVELSGVDENIVQWADQRDDRLANRARALALKVVHRHVGGVPEINLLRVESIFRPYWIAFYGEVIEGRKVRYLPIPADGAGSHRSF